MSVADHTALITFGQHPVYARVLLRQYAQQRRILVIPSTALMAACAFADSPDFSPLYQSRVVVRWSEVDHELAQRIHAEVPILGPRADWHLVAPVVWSAHSLHIPVLTQQPELYSGYDVAIDPLP